MLKEHNFTNAGQIFLFTCENSSVGSESVTYTTLGAYIYFCKNITITGLNASYNAFKGIYINHGSWNNIVGCFVSNNCYSCLGSPKDSALFASYSSYNNITENTVYDNAENGIGVVLGSHNTVFLNTIYDNNEDGIDIGSSSDNTIEDNMVTNNGRYGIYLDSYISNNNVTGNTVLGNLQCIVDEGSNNDIWGNDCGIPADSSSGGGGGGDSSDSGSGCAIPFGNFYLFFMIAACLALIVLTYRKLKLAKNI